MRDLIFTVILVCFFLEIANAQTDSLHVIPLGNTDSTLIIRLNKCHGESKIPKLMIDWLEVEREAIRMFEIKKSQIKKVVVEDGIGNVKTKLIMILNDTMLVSSKEKKENLSIISIGSVKSLNYLDRGKAIKLFGRKGRNGALIIETY